MSLFLQLRSHTYAKLAMQWLTLVEHFEKFCPLLYQALRDNVPPLNPTPPPITLHPTPCTLNPKLPPLPTPCTLYPKPEPQTPPNPPPYTLHPTPYTLHPKSQTLNQMSELCQELRIELFHAFVSTSAGISKDIIMSYDHAEMAFALIVFFLSLLISSNVNKSFSSRALAWS